VNIYRSHLEVDQHEVHLGAMTFQNIPRHSPAVSIWHWNLPPRSWTVVSGQPGLQLAGPGSPRPPHRPAAPRRSPRSFRGDVPQGLEGPGPQPRWELFPRWHAVLGPDVGQSVRSDPRCLVDLCWHLVSESGMN
jgi:hypothetical protein